MIKRVAICAMSLSITLAGLSFATAGERSKNHCIQTWPDSLDFYSMLPNPKRVRDQTGQEITGTVAHLIAYIEHAKSDGRLVFERVPQITYIFPTVSGRYVIRFHEPLPIAFRNEEALPDHGPY